MASFCPNCGSALEGAPKFCPSCGSPVAAAVAPAAQAPQQPPAPPQQQPMNQPRPGMTPPVPDPQPNQGAMPPRPGMQPPVNQPAPGMGAPQGQGFGRPEQGPGMMQRPGMQGPGAGQPGMQSPAFGQPQGGAFGQPGMPQGFQRPGAPVPFGQGGAPFGQPNQPQPFGQPYGAAAFGGGAYVPDQGIMAMFFRYDNRLNRKPYILRSLALFCVTVVLAVAVTFIGGRKFGDILAFLVSILCSVPAIMLMIRRLHDLDRPTWWAIGTFIPLVNMALSIYLLFFEGTRGPNQYGPDPLEGQH